MPRLHVRTPQELAIELDDGQRFALHPLWLRERCRDPLSMDLRTGQRLHDPSDLDPALSVTAAGELESGRFRTRVSDGHQAELLGRDLLEQGDWLRSTSVRAWISCCCGHPTSWTSISCAPRLRSPAALAGIRDPLHARRRRAPDDGQLPMHPT